MDRTERFYRIEQLLRTRKVVTARDFQDALEVSRATFKRDMEYLRSRLDVPIVWDREAGGYRLEHREGRTELPGLWFSDAEAHALLALEHLLGSLGSGVLEAQLKPLASRLQKLLGSRGHAAEQVRRRIRILHQARREAGARQFDAVAAAVLQRRRMHINHYNRATDARTQREVSPLRLVHYRDNWYLDAWCHLRDGLRSFAVDAIESARTLEAAAIEVPDMELDAVLASGYGIFGGASVQWARLRFSPERARWAARAQWHPDQRGEVLPDGGWVLELPYSDPRELVMDILRHGAEVEVLAPASLRSAVATELARAAARYAAEAGGG
jgi:predicted DNA-binding transcriptional regulator YafY